MRISELLGRVIACSSCASNLVGTDLTLRKFYSHAVGSGKRRRREGGHLRTIHCERGCSEQKGSIVLNVSARLGPSYPWYHGQVSPEPWRLLKCYFTLHDPMIIVLDASARLGPSYPWYHGQVSPDPWRLQRLLSRLTTLICAGCFRQARSLLSLVSWTGLS